jgi:hypothetical protein
MPIEIEPGKKQPEGPLMLCRTVSGDPQQSEFQNQISPTLSSHEVLP